MVKRIHIGPSIGSYPKWKPKFSPSSVSAAKFLLYQAARINSVEVNDTIRDTRTPEPARRWRKATPSGFLFSVKARFGITHLKRRRGGGDAVAEFVDSPTLSREEEKLHPVCFQLPENFRFDLRRRKQATPTDPFFYLRHEDSPDSAFLDAPVLTDPSKLKSPGISER